MNGFFKDFMGLGIKYTICLVLVFPMLWLIKWQAPSLDDILKWENFRILSSLWLLSAIGAWWLNRD